MYAKNTLNKAAGIVLANKCDKKNYYNVFYPKQTKYLKYGNDTLSTMH